ncbi:MAG: hypothetical protein WCK67_05015 [bacterium]
MAINNVSGSFDALQKLYYQKYGTQANADELTNYAKMQNENIFGVWDKLAGGDGVNGNVISSDRYYANNNDLLFQAKDGKIANFDMKNGTVNQATNTDLAKKLDMLDDNVYNYSMTPDVVAKSNIVMGRDTMDVFEADNKKTPGIETQDYNTNIITVSSEDTSKLLKDSAKNAGFKTVTEFVNAQQTNKDLSNQYKASVSDYLVNTFGGNKEAVLRNLADVQQLPTSQTMIDNIYGQVIDKVSSGITNTYKDKSTSNNDINFFKADYYPTAIHFGDLKTAIGNAIGLEQQAAGRKDPIGFETKDSFYNFVEDKNNDKKFNNANEFVGANGGWADLLKYDTDKSGTIKGNELDKLKVLVTDKNTGASKTLSAKDAGINELNLASYQAINQTKKDGNFLAGLFDMIFKGNHVQGQQTYDNEEYLKNMFSNAYGIDIAA